jgi:hypothetical protein
MAHLVARLNGRLRETVDWMKPVGKMRERFDAAA